MTTGFRTPESGSLPLASAVCCTYGRPRLLAESLQCFLQQDYPNKELIIVNDQPGVELVVNLPTPHQVRVVNVPDRFPSLGSKREFGKQLVEGEYYFIWDDDDLYLPWRLSDSICYLEGNPEIDIVNPIRAVVSKHNVLEKILSAHLESQCCIRRRWFDAHSYSDNPNEAQTLLFMNGARMARPEVRPFYWLLYRWGLGIYHISGAQHTLENWVRAGAQGKAVPRGEYLIEPASVQEFWAGLDKFLETSLDPDEYSRWTIAIAPYL